MCNSDQHRESARAAILSFKPIIITLFSQLSPSIGQSYEHIPFARGGETYNPTWEISAGVSLVDISQNVLAYIDAEQVIPAAPSGPSSAQLVFRCQEGVTSGFVAFDGQRLSDEGEHGVVHLRLDSGKPFARRMYVSKDGEALGMWSGREPIRLIRDLLDAELLVVRVTPIEHDPITAIFDISGVETAVLPLYEACGWSPRSIWGQLGDVLLMPY